MRYLHEIGTVNGKIPRSHTSFHVPISMLHDIPAVSSMCMLLTHKFTFILLMHVKPSRVQFIEAYKACFQHPLLLLKLPRANIKTLHARMLFQS